MKTKSILRLLKAIIFIFAVNGYGVLAILHKPIWSTICFAVALAMYLIELYGGNYGK